MRPLFTVHAGEYLVGSHIEMEHPKWHVWVPSQDTGVDLLVTNSRNTKAVSLQVKFSKDFNPTNHPATLRDSLVAAGWWTHQYRKISDSRADFWVFALPSFSEHKTSFIILTPAELLRRFRHIHGDTGKRIQSYLWVTRSKCCWEGRGLNDGDRRQIAIDGYRHKHRNFTQFLDAWKQVEGRLTS